MRASAWAAAILAVMTVMGAAGCSSSDSGEGSKEPSAKPAGPVEVATENKIYKDRPLELKDAQYVRVNSLADPVAAARVNKALRGPIDWAAAWMAALDPDQKRQCTGKTSVLKSRVRMGLQGPELVSAATSLQLAPCFEADGTFPTQAVTVDLKAGKAVTAADVFRPGTLTKSGLARLWSRLSGDKADWTGCGLGALEREFLFPIKEGDGLPDTPAPLNLLFTRTNLEVFWSEPGTSCNNFTFSAPYATVKDLMKPEFAARLA